MKKVIFALAACAVVVCSAGYQQKPGMKTVWGEKVTPANAWREYPRPQMVRANWTNLNGLWQYTVTKNGPGIPTAWDGEILVPFVIESSLSGVGRLLDPGETLWYKRLFTATPKEGDRVLLHFDQADFRTIIYVNGRQVDLPHEGGQMPFSYDITELVQYGDKNELLVSVWDPTSNFVGSAGKQSFKPSGCFYTRSSGIGGTVWLETVPTVYIAGYKVTPDIDEGTVSFTFDVKGAGFSIPEVTVEAAGVKATSQDGRATLKLPAGFKLWSPETPNLYDFTATCAGDTVKGYFGMRKIEVRKDPNGVLRMYFNNQPRFLIGTLDQGWWPDGLLTPPSDEAMAFDIKELKKMGFDMMRKHIKVEPLRYYYLCDKLGIIVMQDMPSGGGNDESRYGFYRRELREMIDHLYNVPSIVCWIPYNEGWGQPGSFLTHATLTWTEDYDPSRIVNGPSGWRDYEGGWVHPHVTQHKPDGSREAAHLIDKHDYGHRPGMWPVNSRRASFLGEFGGIGCRINGHLWTENAWGYGGTGKLTAKESEGRFISLMDHVATLAESGLCGSVYTQTTDVEGEINGLLTYDRKVLKYDAKAMAAVHERVRKAAALGVTPRKSVTVAPVGDTAATAWSYTFAAPGEGWTKPGFNDGAWKRSAAGFGNEQIRKDFPTLPISTDWSTPEIWLRRHFTYAKPQGEILRAVVKMFHDEDVEVYLNGTLLVSAQGYATAFKPFGIAAEKFNSLVKEGDNVIAVKVIQKSGGQYIDLGINLELKK